MSFATRIRTRSQSVDSYRQSLVAEQTRRAVLGGQGRPKFLKEIPAHVELRLQALQAYASGDRAAADALLDQANSETPGVRGTLNGQTVAALRDADDLFGPVLEVIGGENYVWAPIDQIETVTLNPPTNPRDVIFRPAHLVYRDGPSGDVLLPALYPGSHSHPDEAIRVGRVTDWPSGEDGPSRGAGGKLFLAGEGWVRFVDWAEFTASSS